MQLPIGLTPEQNLCKEAKEEAGIEATLAMTAKKTGEINYRLERHDGLRSDTLFIYDLELPENFTPANTDGEVASFTLMPLSEIAKATPILSLVPRTGLTVSATPPCSVNLAALSIRWRVSPV